VTDFSSRDEITLFEGLKSEMLEGLEGADLRSDGGMGAGRKRRARARIVNDKHGRE
jgi:hypothetical protein